MFVHPHCPCTRSSLNELSAVVAAAPDRARVIVLVFSPDGVPDTWHQSENWERAGAILGVEVVADHDDAERVRFGVHTSGQVVLYDASGRLAYHGGITAGRGHGGPNPGRAAVMAALSGSPGVPGEYPVFGCPFDSESDRGVR